jgi:hypothetical protein
MDHVDKPEDAVPQTFLALILILLSFFGSVENMLLLSCMHQSIQLKGLKVKVIGVGQCTYIIF